MTWLWKVPDLRTRVAFARKTAPGDIFTQLALVILHPITALLAMILAPVDFAARQLGKLSLVFAAWGLIFFFVLTALWMPFWGMLTGSSWLWLNYPWTRPILFLPGAALSIVLTVFLMIVPDPQKHPKYVTMAQVWPLTWQLWHPPLAYFEEYGIDDPDLNPYKVDQTFGSKPNQESAPRKYDPTQST